MPFDDVDLDQVEEDIIFDLAALFAFHANLVCFPGEYEYNAKNALDAAGTYVKYRNKAVKAREEAREVFDD